MFERFTDRARHALELAQQEARLLNHGFVGTEHILLGLIHEGEGVAARTLASLNISLDAVREKVIETVGAAVSAPNESPPFTPRAKKVLELSLREAMQLGHNYIGTEHLLLGIVREGEGVAAQVLVSLGADLGRVRENVIRIVSGYGVGERTAPSPRPSPMIAGRPGPPPSSARASSGSADNTIVVIGEGSAAVTPDASLLQVGLETGAGSAGEALAMLAERSAAVLAAAKGRGVSEEDLQTRGLTLHPQMDERGRRVVEYLASYWLTVRVSEIAAVSEVVDAISQAAGDALRLGGFRLSTSATDDARADAGARAVDDARRRAQRLADAAGVRLGRVLSIAESGAMVPARIQAAGFAVHAAPVSAPVHVEAGTQELTARVTVTFEILD